MLEKSKQLYENGSKGKYHKITGYIEKLMVYLLHKGLSPELITSRLLIENKICISFKAICSYIYKNNLKGVLFSKVSAINIEWKEIRCKNRVSISGSNENMNRYIRQSIPKSTDFDGVSHEFLRSLEITCNNRPKKYLNYLTPNKVHFGISLSIETTI